MTKAQTEQYNQIEKLASELFRKADDLFESLQDYMDSKSEDWQESDAAAEVQDAIDRLDSFLNTFGDAKDEL